MLGWARPATFGVEAARGIRMIHAHALQVGRCVWQWAAARTVPLRELIQLRLHGQGCRPIVHHCAPAALLHYAPERNKGAGHCCHASGHDTAAPWGQGRLLAWCAACSGEQAGVGAGPPTIFCRRWCMRASPVTRRNHMARMLGNGMAWHSTWQVRDTFQLRRSEDLSQSQRVLQSLPPTA